MSGPGASDKTAASSIHGRKETPAWSWNGFAGLFSNDLAIDLGTANTLVALRDKGIVLSEPSVVAVKQEQGGVSRIVAVGTDAKKMLEQDP